MTKNESYRVLVADDEEQVRNFIVSLLSKYRHSCDVAKDGAEALEIIKKGSFDLHFTMSARSLLPEACV